MKTVLIFDQAESPGGSISRAVELAEKMTAFSFIFITLHSLEYLKASTKYNHIKAKRIFSFYNDQDAIKHSSWLKKKLPYSALHALASHAIAAIIKINRTLLLWQAIYAIGATKIDVIQANCGLHSLPFQIAKRKQVSLIYYFRDLQNYSTINRDRILLAKHFVFVGQTLMDLYVQQLNLPVERCLMVHSPFDVRNKMHDTAQVNLEIIKGLRAQQKKIIVLPARISEDKGQLVALNAIKLLAAEMPDICLLMAGSTANNTKDQSYHQKLNLFIKDNNLSRNVIFLGYRKDILHIIESADIAIQTPVYFEALSGALVESLQLGIPTVSSDVGGASEAILDHKTGFLFPVGDHAKLAEKLKWIFKNRDEALQIATQGQATAIAKWSPEIMQEKMRHLYLHT